MNVSVDHVRELADSIRVGLHEPVIEVEELPGVADRYQVVCGEQRWRAARLAGRTHVLARVLRPLGHWERFQRQYQENQLRAPLDPVEQGRAILQAKTIRDIAAAERLLSEAGVPFDPLERRTIADRDGVHEHLAGLKRLLVEAGVRVVRSGDQLVCGPLSPWRETERALGISEAARKQKVGILRLPPELLDEVRQLPAEHAIQVSRLEDRDRQEALVRRAPKLTHRQVRDAVDRLRRDPHLEVDQVLEDASRDSGTGDPLAFESQIEALADLCRQLTRRLGILRPRLQAGERDQVAALLRDLRHTFEDTG